MGSVGRQQPKAIHPPLAGLRIKNVPLPYKIDRFPPLFLKHPSVVHHHRQTHELANPGNHPHRVPAHFSRLERPKNVLRDRWRSLENYLNQPLVNPKISKKVVIQPKQSTPVKLLLLLRNMPPPPPPVCPHPSGTRLP